MKKIIYVMILTFVLTGVACARTAAKSADFNGSPAWSKLDLHARNAWSESADNTTLECMIKTTREMSEDDKADLKKAGYNLQSTIGKILTGNVKRKDIPNVAALEFVQAVELAVPMTLKKK